MKQAVVPFQDKLIVPHVIGSSHQTPRIHRIATACAANDGPISLEQPFPPGSYYLARAFVSHGPHRSPDIESVPSQFSKFGFNKHYGVQCQWRFVSSYCSMNPPGNVWYRFVLFAQGICWAHRMSNVDMVFSDSDNVSHSIRQRASVGCGFIG